MLKNLLTKAKAALTTVAAPAWRGSSGETVARRKARQENEKPVTAPFVLKAYGTRSSRVTQGEARTGKHHKGRVYPGKRPNDPTGAISFHPLGSRLSMRVRRNLRWGHTWATRKIAAAIAKTKAA